jgi:hypothetical protein
VSEFYNPDSWLDVVGLAVIGCSLVGTAAIPAFFANRNHRAIKRVDQKTDLIQKQVVNGHAENPDSPNLRDDLDGIKSVVDDLRHAVDRLSRQVGSLFADQRGLRSDVMAQEEMRRLQISDLRDEIGHQHRKNRP